MSWLAIRIVCDFYFPGLPPAEIIHMPDRIDDDDRSDKLAQQYHHQKAHEILDLEPSGVTSPKCCKEPGEISAERSRLDPTSLTRTSKES